MFVYRERTFETLELNQDNSDRIGRGDEALKNMFGAQLYGTPRTVLGMKAYRASSRGRSRLLFSAVAGMIVLAVGGIAFGLVAPSLRNSGTQSSSPSARISLSLSVTPQAAPFNSTFLINATAFNSLSRPVTLPNSSDYNGVELNPICNFGPVTVEVLNGYYSPANFSSGTPLEIHGVQTVLCILTAYPLESYTFQSHSTLFSGQLNLEAQNRQVTRAAQAVVYLNQIWSSDFASHSPLARGIYTAVAADAWGQVAVTHFTVL